MKKLSFFKVALLLYINLLPSVIVAQTCASGNTGGTVWRDYNSDGIKDLSATNWLRDYKTVAASPYANTWDAVGKSGLGDVDILEDISNAAKPILSDFEFNAQGYMYLGFVDKGSIRVSSINRKLVLNVTLILIIDIKKNTILDYLHSQFKKKACYLTLINKTPIGFLNATANFIKHNN
jgi:hypothetical protein